MGRSARPRWRRWLRRIAIAVPVTLAALVLALLLVVHTDWGRAQLRAQVIAALRTSFPGGAELGRLDGSVLGELELQDLVLFDREHRPAVTIARLRVNLGWLALWRHTVRLEEVRADGVAILADRRAGTLNLATMTRPSSGGSSWNLELERLQVTQAAATLTMASPGAADGAADAVAHLDDLHVEGSLGLDRAGTLRAQIVQAGGRWRERALAATLAAQLRVVDRHLELPALDLALGGVTLRGRDLQLAGAASFGGTVELRAAAGALRQLVPGLAASPALALTVQAAPVRLPGLGDQAALGAVRVHASGSIDQVEVAASLLAQLGTPRLRLSGQLALAHLELAQLGLLQQASIPTATLRFDLAADRDPLTLDNASGALRAAARIQLGGVSLEPVTVSATLRDRQLTAEWAAATGESRLAGHGQLVLHRDGGLELRTADLSGQLVAVDLRSALPLAGRAELALHAAGWLRAGAASAGAARPPLQLSGTVEGQAVRYATWSAGRVALALDHVEPQGWPRGAATVTIANLANRGQPWPEVEVHAESTAERSFEILVAAHAPRAAAATARFAATARATVTIAARGDGATATVHELTGSARGLMMSGRNATLVARPGHLEVRGLRLHGNGGELKLDATFDATSDGDRTSATLSLSGLRLALLSAAVPAFGPLAGTVDVAGSGSLHGNQLEVRGRGTARDLVVRPGAPAIDATVVATLTPRLAHVELTAGAAAVGELTAALEVVPPANPRDGAAWSRLERAAIGHVTLRSRRLELGALARLVGIRALEGTLEGAASVAVELGAAGGTATIATQRLILAGAPAPIDLSATVTFDDAGHGAIAVRGGLAGLATATATALLHLPAHPFEATAWTLTPERIARVEVAVPTFLIDETVARRLQLGSWRGRAAATFTLDQEANQLRGHLVLDDVRGEPLRTPAALTADLLLDGDRARLTASGALGGTQVLTATTEVPLDLTRRAGGLAAWRTLPVTGSLTLGPVELAPVLRAVAALTPISTARRPLTGQLTGTAQLTGTLGAPSVELDTTISDVGSTRARLRELRLRARVSAAAVHAELSAAEAAGGTLRAVVDLDPRRPELAHLGLDAKAFDLAPIARLVPGALLGMAGVLTADLQLEGLLPATAKVAGTLELNALRLPIINQLGTFTEGVARLTFTPGRATADLQGRIEAGKAALHVEAALDGLLPRTAVLDLAIANLSVITALAPRLDGTLHAEAALADGRWKVEAQLRKGAVRVPDEPGRVLHPVGTPADLVFVSNARAVTRPPKSLAASARSWAGGRARSPWVEIALAIEPVKITSSQLVGSVAGNLELQFSDQGVNIYRTISVSRGDVKLYGRRYQIQRAAVTFDGSIDPVIDIQLQYDFPQLSMTVAVRGRLSDPRLSLSSQPASYTEAQLLGFVLGGSPDAGGGNSLDAASGVAAAVASQTLGGFLTRQLPVRIDVLGYQPQTLSSSASVVAGTWLTEKLLLLFRSRSDPRPLENGAEGELQYWIRRGLLLDGIAGDRGSFGLDLLWNRRW